MIGSEFNICTSKFTSPAPAQNDHSFLCRVRDTVVWTCCGMRGTTKAWHSRTKSESATTWMVFSHLPSRPKNFKWVFKMIVYESSSCITPLLVEQNDFLENFNCTWGAPLHQVDLGRWEEGWTGSYKVLTNESLRPLDYARHSRMQCNQRHWFLETY